MAADMFMNNVRDNQYRPQPTSIQDMGGRPPMPFAQQHPEPMRRPPQAQGQGQGRGFQGATRQWFDRLGEPQKQRAFGMWNQMQQPRRQSFLNADPNAQRSFLNRMLGLGPSPMGMNKMAGQPMQRPDMQSFGYGSSGGTVQNGQFMPKAQY